MKCISPHEWPELAHELGKQVRICALTHRNPSRHGSQSRTQRTIALDVKGEGSTSMILEKGYMHQAHVGRGVLLVTKHRYLS